MSLFSSLQLASNSLIANQIGLQVTGNNIANSNTPGYIREEVLLTPAPTQRKGKLLLGLGVQVDAIIQKTDKFLESRLRGATSDVVSGETQDSTYQQLEAIIGELSDTDLSTSLNSFFGSINDILNQPESIGVRNLAVLKGKTLAEDIKRLASRVREIRDELNDRIINTAGDINRLLSDIAELNVQIVTLEGGDSSSSDAVGLRDRRVVALGELSSIVDLRTKEQDDGSVTVFAGGDFLVFNGFAREVEVEIVPINGVNVAQINLASTDSILETSSGRVAGLVQSRDEIVGGFLDKLDDFARTIIFEFNKSYSSGQGLKGHDELTSEFSVDATDMALDQAGLEFTPVTGSFRVQTVTKQGDKESRKTYDVFIDLDGLDNDDTTLEDLRATLDGIDGITAIITPSRKLNILSDSSNIEFSFLPGSEQGENDTSGVLAALGLNTFFTGTSASDMGVSDVVREDPGKFAGSLGGIANDTRNIEILAGFQDKKLESQSGDSLTIVYDLVIAEVTQGAAVASAVSEGFRVFQQTLEGQKLAISGVSIDEEVVKMITFQRSFQASARFIRTISELLDLLVNL